MIRLFVGIELPDELRQRIALIQTGVERAQWVPTENIHLTLRFIGNILGDGEADALDALETIHAPPFSLTLNGVGHFESRKRLRALWLSVERSDALIDLRNRIESALVRAGLEPERVARAEPDRLHVRVRHQQLPQRDRLRNYVTAC